MTAFGMLVALYMVLLMVIVFSLCGWLLGPRPRHEGDAEVPYETGMRPLSPMGSNMPALYWRFAVLFVVFDVDLALLLPWILNRSVLDVHLMVTLTFFIGLVLFMLAYFWRKGVLECR